MKKIVVVALFVAACWFVWIRRNEMLPAEIVVRIDSLIPAALRSPGEDTSTQPASTSHTPLVAPSAMPLPQSVSTPPPKQEPVAAKPTPFPDGTYCLREDVSVTTDSGVTGFSAGTQVSKVKSQGAYLLVTDGTSAFKVKLSQVTDDPQTASNLVLAQAEKNSSLAQWRASQVDAIQARQDAARAGLASLQRQLAANSGTLWLTDYDVALLQAKAQNKKVLLNFTGSDWCRWCMKTEADVFSKKEFKDYAIKNLVLVKLDYPDRMPLSSIVQAQNERLKALYNIQGYPTNIILDSSGNELGRFSGYCEGGPPAYIQIFEGYAKR